MIDEENRDDVMDNTKPTSVRRDLVKVLGLGGFAAVTLPARWSKPVVESVLLPAHDGAPGVVGGGTGGLGGEATGTIARSELGGRNWVWSELSELGRTSSSP